MVSRIPRARMLRSARIEVAGTAGEVRIRDISATGAMIDGIEAGDDAIGVDLLIELLEDEMFPARLRWASDGKAGIEFVEHFNLERLNQPARGLRKAGGHRTRPPFGYPHAQARPPTKNLQPEQ